MHSPDRNFVQVGGTLVAYFVVLLAYVKLTPGLSNVFDGNSMTEGGFSARVFDVLAPLATLIAARRVGWPMALALPAIFVFVVSQVITSCQPHGCDDVAVPDWIGVIYWALVVILPVASLGSFRSSTRSDEVQAPLAGFRRLTGPRARALYSYVLLVVGCVGLGLDFIVEPPDYGENPSDAFILAQLAVISTIGTVAVAYQGGRLLAGLTPFLFAGSVFLGLGTVEPFGVVLVTIIWSIAVVIPSAVIGVRMAENREGRWIDRIRMRHSA